MRISDWSSDVCSSDLHEDADRDDADDLRPQSAAEDADREGAPDAGNQVGRDGADDVVDLQLVEQRYREDRSEEHTSELQSLMRNSYAVVCLKKKKKK